jgi:hypothetical protein
MLQRIQTVYWVLTVLCLGGILSGVDLVIFQKDQSIFNLSIYSLKHFDLNGELINQSMSYNFIIILIDLLLILYTIFQFKNLKKQLNLSKWIMYFNLLVSFLIVLFSYSGMIVSNPSSIHLNFWVALLFVGFIFSVLAYLGVKKDKSLLDSVDRIR